MRLNWTDRNRSLRYKTNKTSILDPFMLKLFCGSGSWSVVIPHFQLTGLSTPTKYLESLFQARGDNSASDTVEARQRIQNDFSDVYIFRSCMSWPRTTSCGKAVPFRTEWLRSMLLHSVIHRCSCGSLVEDTTTFDVVLPGPERSGTLLTNSDDGSRGISDSAVDWWIQSLPQAYLPLQLVGNVELSQVSWACTFPIVHIRLGSTHECRLIEV